MLYIVTLWFNHTTRLVAINYWTFSRDCDAMQHRIKQERDCLPFNPGRSLTVHVIGPGIASEYDSTMEPSHEDHP